MDIRSTPISAPIAWVTEAAKLFFSNFVPLIIITVVYFLILVVLGFIPILGQIATLLLMPIFAAGLYTAVSKAQKGEKPLLGDLFLFFSHEKTGKLVLLSLAPLAFMIALFIVVAILGAGGAGLAALTGGGGDSGAAIGGFAMLIGLITGVLSALFYFAVLFAVPLVAFKNHEVVPAIKLAFSATLKNIFPLLLMSLISVVLIMAGLFLFVIGAIITAPISFIALFLAYQDIFASESK
jgi:uncharacterized membrane protein